MQSLSRLLLVSAALLLTACAQSPRQPAASAGLTSLEAASRYQQGLSRYHDSRYDAALIDLNAAVSSGHLKTSDALNARKHIAFIHCVNNREAQCREQFQAILKADPGYDLPTNEASHPNWGPVWRSLKGALEDQRAVARGSGLLASKGQQKLAEGIKEYDAGRYKAAIAALEAALKSGLSSSVTDETRAHKYSAFSYCLTGQQAKCAAAFRAIYKIDPAFQLRPSEAGHPAWAAIYRKERAAAKPARK